ESRMALHQLRVQWMTRVAGHVGILGHGERHRVPKQSEVGRGMRDEPVQAEHGVGDDQARARSLFLRQVGEVLDRELTIRSAPVPWQGSKDAIADEQNLCRSELTAEDA